MPYLIAIALGPVQDFIAASRKTRDLWFGSQLLSEASRAAATRLQADGATLIFPAPSAIQRRHTAVANKLRVVVNGDPPRVKDVVDLAHKSAQDILGGYCRDVLNCYGGMHLGSGVRIDDTLLKLQVADFLEFYAAWLPCDPNDPRQYKRTWREVEWLLAGRKALRDFKPAHGLDGVPKSMLDPALESVLRPVPASAAPGSPLGPRLKRGEQLDGISLLKRAGESSRFASLSRVAIDPFIRRIERHPWLGSPPDDQPKPGAPPIRPRSTGWPR